MRRVVDLRGAAGLRLLAAGRHVAEVDVVPGAHGGEVVGRVDVGGRRPEGAEDLLESRRRDVRPEVREVLAAAGAREAAGESGARALRSDVRAERRRVRV